jgi:iron complex outermembrane receptor protein
MALAQTAPDTPTSTTELDVVVVTGSLIRGSAEDAALPVDVITSQDLEEQGSPTVVQLVKTITASTAAIGESNRYNVGAGTAQINLRGFGAARSLVLMNSHRLVDNPIAAGQNLNFVPTAAIGRVEILKEGAAATYGSDAIGGVVNFITRTDLQGVEVNAEYSYIDGSDGDYQADLAWGTKTENGNILVTFGYRHRSQLDIRERDWAVGKYFDPGYGGWTGASNPGIYVQNVTSLAPPTVFRDNGCSELGGVLTTGALGQPVIPGSAAASSAASTCRFEFSQFNDLVNREDHYQLYAEVNGKIGDGVKSHTEFAWGRDFVPEQRLSPANLTARFPTPITPPVGNPSFVGTGTSGSLATPNGANFFVRYNVPLNNPGLVELRNTCATSPVFFGAGSTCASLASPIGIDISQTAWRAITFAGHPTNADGADHQVIDTKSFRVSSGLTGTIFEAVDWDATATYMQSRSSVSTNDLLVDRIQLALNGFGSLDGAAPCQATTNATRIPANAGNASIGCYYFNPFTNSVAVSAVNGQNNPFYRPAAANNPLLVKWMYGNYIDDFENELAVFDGVLSGKTGFDLPGGTVGWALGTQYRYTRERVVIGDLHNSKINPCVDSIDDGTPVCGAPDSPNEFFGSGINTDVSRNVYAVFGELSIPILPSIDASLAVRYESYPGKIGDTTNPKLSVRWQALDWFAIRGSAGTTFRAPTASLTSPNCTSGVANLGGQYRATLTCGNPDLEPETAKTYDFGLVFNPGNLKATIDYYYFDFTKELTAESVSRLFTSMFPTATGHCGDPAYAALEARFTFAGLCNSANVVRVQANNVNGPSTLTSGVDAQVQYDWSRIFGGRLSAGMDATYLIKYARGAFTLKDNPSITFATPEDRAGLHDLVAQFFSYPKLKGNLFASWNRGNFTFRLQTRYQEGTSPAFGTPLNKWVFDGTAYVQQPLGKTADFWQEDLIVRWQAPWDLTITGSVQNVMDKDPPFAPSNFNYDYTNGNPLGRVVEINIKKKF